MVTIEEHFPLAQYTTLKIGGRAKFAVLVKAIDDVRDARVWAKEKGLKVMHLSAGSNTLVADGEIDGLVLIMKNDQLEWNPPQVIAGAGVKLGQLIGGAAAKGMGGLGWLIGVPGAVGGSIYGNAGTGSGAKPVEAIGQYVDWVEFIGDDGTAQRFTKEQCDFKYRSSIFKTMPVTITQVQLTLPAADPKEERTHLAAMSKKKGANQPLAASSAGCMFTNPTVAPEDLSEELRATMYENGTVSAWRLIHGVGLQGKQLGNIQISDKHANFMVNLGGATADEVVQLLSLVKQQVRDKMGIQLHEEVQYLGF